MKRGLVFLLSSCITINFCIAQKASTSKVDSLLLLLSHAKEDTNKINLLNQLGFESGTVKFTVAKKYLSESIHLANKLNFKKGLADALSNLSLVYELQGNYFESLNLQLSALKIREDINDSAGISFSIHYIGDIYFSQGELTDKTSTKREYNEKALENYFKSLKISEAIQNLNSTANNFNCIGNAYREENQYSQALEYYFKAVNLREEEGNKRRLAQTFGQIGKLYLEKHVFDSALYYAFKSLKLCEETGYTRTYVKTLGTIGNVFLEERDYAKAIEYCNRSLAESKSIGFMEFIAKANYSLSRIYSAHDFKGRDADKALAYYKQYIVERDSINSKNANQAELQFDFNRKEAQAKADQEKKDVMVIEERKKQKLMTFFVTSGLISVLIFAGFIFRSLRIRNKQNSIISAQKHLVEEKQKEITDSINYAQRIQRALLVSEKILKNNLPEHFVFFQPKDIVSGDFYWASVLNENAFALVVADSTGHGVPGAIMSMLNISCLNEATGAANLSEPFEILNHTRSRIIQHLANDGSEEGGKDGMDCSFISFDFKNKTLKYAGANNPLWIVRHNLKNSAYELLELLPDKMPVGKHEKDSISFSQQTLNLEKGDTIFAFTDGLPDQFGGARGKKFMYKQFKELLLSIATQSLDQQKEAISLSFSKWKGDLEQVDDVCIIGVRV